MALSIRRRGDIWYARGTIRVGRQTVTVREFSTGTDSRADAEAIAEAEAGKVRANILDGPAGRQRHVTIAQCLLEYLNRRGGVRARDQQPIRDLSLAIGSMSLADAAEAWRAWARKHKHHAAGTLQKYRNILAAGIRHGAAELGTQAPPLPAVVLTRAERAQALSGRVLAPDERERLLCAYTPHAACAVLLLAEQGMRTGETLRLDWADVQLETETLVLRPEETKSGRGRAVPMTRRTSLLLWGMWEAAGRPRMGRVFRTYHGRVYADQRVAGGGNPLSQAHITACKLAGVKDFRVHDWRHDWATRQVMAGMDLMTLAEVGGWEDIKMLRARYGRHITREHVRAQVRQADALAKSGQQAHGGARKPHSAAVS